VFLFYVFFEAMLIPVYFLIGRYGGPRRNYAAVKFLLYSLFGGLLMLAALIALYVVSADELGKGTFDFTALAGLDIPLETQKWLFAGFFLAFAIKAPLVPFHTWLPDAAAESTPGTAVLLVGVLDKVGTFGMLRYCLELFPEASTWATPVVIALAVISIIYGALLAIGQNDIKRLIAYTSVSHFGFIVLGVFVMTTQGQSGATLYMVNHGFSTAALFLIAGYMISRRGSRFIDDFGGDLAGAALPPHGGEAEDERAEHEDQLDRPAVGAREERLEQHREDGGAEHDEDRRDRRVLDRGRVPHGRRRGGEDGAHFCVPSATGTCGAGSVAPTLTMTRSTAGLMTSSTGCGKNPSAMMTTSSGAIARTSRPLRSPTVSRTASGVGPVMVRWYMSSM
jgi:hypothetical protein